MFLTRWNGRSMMEIHNLCWSPKLCFPPMCLDPGGGGGVVPCGRMNGSNASGSPRGQGKGLL